MAYITDENDNLVYIKDDKHQSSDYFKNKINQKIEIYRKRLKEAEQKRNLTEYVRMEAKIEACTDIWSFYDQ